MQVTFELDEALITVAFKDELERSLKGGPFDRGYGNQAITDQVRAYVLGLDVRERINAACKAMLPGLVEDICATELRKHIKRTMDQMKKDGSAGELFLSQAKPEGK